MPRLKDIKLGNRLAAGFGIVILLLIAVAGYGVFALKHVLRDTDLIMKDRYAKVALATKIEEGVNVEARKLRNLLLYRDAQQQEKEIQEIEKTAALVNDYYKQLGAIVYTEQGNEQLKVMLVARKKFLAAKNQMIDKVKAGDTEGARVLLLGELRPLQLSYMNSVSKMRELQEQGMQSFANDAADQTQLAVKVSIALAVLATVAAGVMARALTRSITQPLREAVTLAQKVAQGDLSSRIYTTRKDEIGQLLVALDAMNDSLIGIVANVRDGSESIASSSAEIAAGTSDLSQRTEQQASNVQQTASSMHQISSTVAQNAESARRVAEMTGRASAEARAGGEVAEQATQTMARITASSNRISEIIGVVDGIAFQTNILALNAAVEAARAGEQGRGFAVVAAEVRNLAQRSAASAREVKSLIGESTRHVEAGVELVNRAGASMRNVHTEIERVNQLIAEISAASEEQSQGVSLVSESVAQLDSTTQGNAALAEESAAACISLSQQSERLLASVQMFKLE